MICRHVAHLRNRRRPWEQILIFNRNNIETAVFSSTTASVFKWQTTWHHHRYTAWRSGQDISNWPCNQEAIFLNFSKLVNRKMETDNTIRRRTVKDYTADNRNHMWNYFFNLQLLCIWSWSFKAPFVKDALQISS